MLSTMLHPMNVAAIYTAAKGRLPWTTEQLRPYVVHSFQDTTKPDSWFFDTFQLLDPDHIARADVNRDGIVDISDSNIVQSVMLHGLNL